MDNIYVFRARREIAAGTTEIVLEPKGSTHFPFQAGQYAELILPQPKYSDDYGTRREFSIASTPSDPLLRFAYRHSQSAWKRNVAELPLGSEIIINGPYGLMTMPDDRGLKIALLGGGIGVTPFWSIISSNTSTRPLHLLFANRDEASAPYLPELRQKRTEGLNLIEHYGLLTDEIVMRLISESQADLYFIAGPMGFTNVAQEALTEAGVPRLNILVEQFTGYE